MKIVIGYDGSDCANRALADLRRAGLPPDTEAMIVSVAEVLLPPPPPSAYELLETTLDERVAARVGGMQAQAARPLPEALKIAIEGSERVQGIFPSWNVCVKFSSGSPASELIKIAEEWKADLIVVGSHGRSALERLVLGSVSHKAVAEARCSMRIGRCDFEANPASIVIVVGVDGSANSEEAVREVAKRQWPQGTQARAVAALAPITPTAIGRAISPIVAWAKETNEEEIASARMNAETAAEELCAAGLYAMPIVVTGDPRHVLINEARRCGADCIFVGASGLGRIERLLLGSVSSWVAVHAPCSVEVVRAG